MAAASYRAAHSVENKGHITGLNRLRRLGMKPIIRQRNARHSWVVLLLLMLTSLPASRCTAAGVTLLERARRVGAAAVNTASRSVIGSKRVAKMLDGDPVAAKGLAKLMISARRAGDHIDDHSVYVRKLMTALHHMQQEIGEDGVKKLLRDFDGLHNWAQQNGQMKGLREVVKSFSSGNKNSAIGYAYELHTAAQYAKMGSLVEIAPKVAGDKKLFRDLIVKQGKDDVYVEIKNWPRIDVKGGAKRLSGQIDNHFKRLKDAGVQLADAPLLRYEFNVRMEGKWTQRLRQRAIQAIRAHYKVNWDVAKKWVEDGKLQIVIGSQM